MDEVWKFFWRKEKNPSQSVWLWLSMSHILHLPSSRTVQLPSRQGYFRKRLVAFPCLCPAAGAEDRKDEGSQTRTSWQLLSRPPKMSLGRDVTALPSLLVTSWEQLIWPLDWALYSQPALQLWRNMMIFRIRYFKALISQTTRYYHNPQADVINRKLLTMLLA